MKEEDNPLFLLITAFHIFRLVRMRLSIFMIFPGVVVSILRAINVSNGLVKGSTQEANPKLPTKRSKSLEVVRSVRSNASIREVYF